MKLKLLFLFLFLTSLTRSQEVFSDALGGQFPASLLTIDGQLYVSAAFGNDSPEGIYRLNFDDPDSPELVSDFSAFEAGIPPFYMVYDPDNNSIYGTTP